MFPTEDYMYIIEALAIEEDPGLEPRNVIHQNDTSTTLVLDAEEGRLVIPPGLAVKKRRITRTSMAHKLTKSRFNHSIHEHPDPTQEIRAESSAGAINQTEEIRAESSAGAINQTEEEVNDNNADRVDEESTSLAPPLPEAESDDTVSETTRPPTPEPPSCGICYLEFGDDPSSSDGDDVDLHIWACESPNCGYLFCVDCIVKWMNTTPQRNAAEITCPQCTRPIPVLHQVLVKIQREVIHPSTARPYPPPRPEIFHPNTLTCSIIQEIWSTLDKYLNVFLRKNEKGKQILFEPDGLKKWAEWVRDKIVIERLLIRSSNNRSEWFLQLACLVYIFRLLQQQYRKVQDLIERRIKRMIGRTKDQMIGKIPVQWLIDYMLGKLPPLSTLDLDSTRTILGLWATNDQIHCENHHWEPPPAEYIDGRPPFLLRAWDKLLDVVDWVGRHVRPGWPNRLTPGQLFRQQVYGNARVDPHTGARQGRQNQVPQAQPPELEQNAQGQPPNPLRGPDLFEDGIEAQTEAIAEAQVAEMMEVFEEHLEPRPTFQRVGPDMWELDIPNGNNRLVQHEAIDNLFWDVHGERIQPREQVDDRVYREAARTAHQRIHRRWDWEREVGL